MKLIILLFIISATSIFIPARDSFVMEPTISLHQIKSDTVKPTTKNGFMIVQDTTVVFDSDTYEEEVIITTSHVPFKAYKADQKRMKKKAKKRSQNNLFEVRDTISSYNPETYEETVTVTINKLTKKEYKEWQKKQKSKKHE